MPDEPIQHKVKATREGFLGHKTACGFIICDSVSFVALPSTKALGSHVRVTGPTGKSCIAQVLDVGPWNEHDDDYVFGDARPAAESGQHVVYVQGEPTLALDTKHVNGSGIDLGEFVWHTLNIKDNCEVIWEFID